MTDYRKPTSRRNFLGYAFGGAMALLLAQSTLAVLKYLQPASTGGIGGLVYAGRVEEFTINSVNRILAGRFYITRTADGLLAMWQQCTHLGCAVPWVEAEGRFHCPCHGSTFNAVGQVLSGPAPRPLDTFPVTVKSGEVWVDTGQPRQRDDFDPSQLTGA